MLGKLIKIVVNINLRIIPVILLMLFVFPDKVNAKDYSIKNADIVVKLNSDGSADITETRTYSFDGQFSWADEWINLKPKCKGCQNYKIKNIDISDMSGKEVLKEYETENERYYIKWYYSAQDEYFRILLATYWS